MRLIWPFILLLALSGCVTKSGVPLTGALDPALAYAYIPLSRPSPILPESDCGAVALGGGVAVTAAHCEKFLAPKAVLAISQDYDLMFFRTDRQHGVLETAAPRLDENVFAIAHYGEVVYRADGVVRGLEAPVKARCETCIIQKTFTFEGNAGPGYSGGPALDTASGKLIGIVFGYTDEADGRRLIYAYPMSLVAAEWQKLKPAAP